jgi:hypothetical protein
MRLRPSQVHAEEHLRPVLRLGAARARLDVDVRTVGVHLAREHAPEFEPLDARSESLQVALDFGHRGGIVFINRESE